MRLKLMSFFCAAATIAMPLHAAPRPPLSDEPIFSAGQIADLDPESGNELDQIVYGAAETLVEDFSVSGIVYTDNSIHKDWTITGAEAKVLLVSIFESLAMQANGAIDGLLYETPKNDAESVTATAVKSFEQATNPMPTCRILIGTKFAVSSSKVKAKPLAAGSTVTWEQAVACFPGAGVAPVAMKSYDRTAAARGKPITRGEFVHKLNEAAGRSIASFSDAIF